MVVDIGNLNSKDEAGFLAGFISSALYFGRALSSPFWGWFADTYGRRPALLISLVSLMIAPISFGFSTSVSFAVLCRFLGGFCNGLVGISKTMVAEIATGQHAAFGMTLCTAMWALGLIMGPAVSGWTTFLPKTRVENPVSLQRNDTLVLSLFDRSTYNPYMLPCVISGSLSTISFVMTYFILKETLAVNSKNAKYKLIAQKTCEDPDPESCSANHEETNQAKDSVKNNKKEGAFKALCEQSFLSVLVCFALLSYAAIFMDEIIPLWAVATIKSGGLNFGTSATGTLLAIAGGFMLLTSLLVYPVIAKFCTAKTILCASCLLYAIVVVLEPILTRLFVGNEASSEAKLWSVLVAMNSLRASLQLIAFNAVFLMTNNSINSRYRGRANGVNMAVSSLFKMLGPASGSVLFAWSINDTPNKLSFVDWHFTFILNATMFVLIVFLAFFSIPESVNDEHPEV